MDCRLSVHIDVRKVGTNTILPRTRIGGNDGAGRTKDGRGEGDLRSGRRECLKEGELVRWIKSVKNTVDVHGMWEVG